MFLLGILALLQNVYIPGFILLRVTDRLYGRYPALRGPEGKLARLVYGFGLSLVFNYLLVFLLTAKRLYHPVAIYLIIILEITALVWIWKNREKKSGDWQLNLGEKVNRVKAFLKIRPLMYNVLLIAACGVILVYAFFFFYFLGSVFEHWDPVTGWNRFAMDWAANRFPTETWRYPQLVAANWSVSYVMMQTTMVQAFAKAFMPLFAIGNLLLFLDMGLKRCCSVYFLGLVFYGGLTLYLYTPSYIASGYMDIPVSFFALLAFHALHLRRDPDAVWWAMLFAAAAGVTKQAGIYMVIVILVWSAARLLHTRKTTGLTGMKLQRRIAVMLTIILVITASWYILKEMQIRQGLDKSEVPLISQVHGKDSLGNRFFKAAEMLLTVKHSKLKPAAALFFMLVLLGIFHRRSRRAALVVAVPFTLLWMGFFSYDTRNLAMAVPFLSFSAAYGTVVLKRLTVGILPKKPIKIPVMTVLVIVIAGLAVLNFTIYKADRLLGNQEAKIKRVGDEGLNKHLYDYYNKHGFTGKIVTNYQYLRFLPDLKEFYYYRPGRVNTGFLDFLETDRGKEIHYMLIPIIQKREKEIYERFWNNIENKTYRLIFKWKGYHFVQVRLYY